MTLINPKPEPAAWWKAILLAAVVLAANLSAWAYLHWPQAAHNFDGKLDGMAYSPFRRDQSPLEGKFPSVEQVREDLKALAPFTKAIRIYSQGEIPQLPAIAAEFGLDVNAGAWINASEVNSEHELALLIDAARRYPNIKLAIVGNEAILRGDVSMDKMIEYLDRARAQIEVPVSTAENWDFWLGAPELAAHVDYIAVHLLPYWEGVPASQALKRASERLAQIQARFPGKRIVVTEFGWPSAGERFLKSRADLVTQALFVRQLANHLRAEHVDGYLMEAIDQPWKAGIEGRVGAYWGMFDAARQPKWTLTGVLPSNPNWPLKALLSSCLALLPIILFARRFGRFYWYGRLFFAGLVQAGFTLLVWLTFIPGEFYLGWLDWTMFLILLPAQIAMVGIIWMAGFEFTEAVAQKHWLRRFDLRPLPPGAVQPRVSIHLACHNEPPDMVMLTLDSLAALDYDNFEVLVVDNNTENEDIWRPVQAHCEKLGAHFRFFHLRPWPGFKAGALNFALKETDPAASIVAVVDSDYAVRADWLRGLVDYFSEEKVAVVQCPQAHRDYEHNAFRRMCNFEYDGFFRIGMHHRNERNAIIQHGTMTMVRKSALNEVGGWAEWCICEDAELGLKLIAAGYATVYVDELTGRGLTPADFTAYKSQRFRWAFGAMQILRAHGGKMIGKSTLDLGQRYHFLTGWFGWFADALHLIFTGMALFWTVGMLIEPELFAMPLQLFLIPVLGFCLLKAFFGVVLYRVRVPCTWRDCLSASMASMALGHAIARGILKGLVSKAHPFERTAKSRRLRRKPNAITAVREEAALLIGLIAAIIGVAVVIGPNQPEADLWIAILIAQALPYLAAVLTARIAANSGEAAG